MTDWLPTSMSETKIPLDEIPCPGTLELPGKDASQPGAFIVHHAEGISAFQNSCPHTGAELNWQPNQFLDRDNEFPMDLWPKMGALGILGVTVEEGRLVFASSFSLYGPSAGRQPPVRADDPIVTTDAYTRSKAECEEMLNASSIDTVIFRIAMTPPVEPGALSPFVFDMHPEMRVEFTHPKDQALAICNSLVVGDEVVNRTLCLGGGQHNRYRYREFMNMAFGAMGIPPLPESAFGDKAWMTDWVDSEESQAILDYIRRHRPPFHYFGDVHQPQATTWRVGATVCRNVGYFRATGRVVFHEAG